ncbi:hypothetical protein OIU84_023889 [Salix udensis]|uniref:Uncharacterized protein n=1 Tax=Salix udensis TaxID=889485 RepID=A0AAD6KU81_9ROSI|nr:hypothetical protein OIU84_023889 [Salix udensis]
MIMSDSKLFDDAKDEANRSPSGTRAGGNVLFPSMNNQLQMSVEPESGVSNLQIANTFLAEENINLNFECGLLKRAQKRQRRNLEEEKEKNTRLADMAENLSKILLMGSDAELRERIAELEASNARLRERNKELEASNAQLRERNAGKKYSAREWK